MVMTNRYTADAWPRMELGMISWIAAGPTPKGMAMVKTCRAISASASSPVPAR